MKRKAYPHRKNSNKHAVLNLRRNLKRRICALRRHNAILRLFPFLPERLTPTYLRDPAERIVHRRYPQAVDALAPRASYGLLSSILYKIVRHVVVVVDVERPVRAETECAWRF